MSDAEIVRKALEELRWACPEHAAFPAIDRLAKDAERLEHAMGVMQITADGCRCGSTVRVYDTRGAIDEHMEKR